MLHVFVGDDSVVVRNKTHAFIDTVTEEAFDRLTAEMYIPGVIREGVSAQSLWGALPPMVFDFLSEEADAYEELLETVPDMALSERLFIVMDALPSAQAGRALKQKDVEYHELKSGSKDVRFNTFLMADAFAQKDKKALWILLARAKAEGIAAEEIAGVLFWQLKALRLAAQTANAKEAGMKDFPYNKAKGALKKFATGELQQLSSRLLEVYHRGHADADMDSGLERFVLGM